MSEGSPYAPHSAAEVEAMLDAVGADSVEALFDIPGELRFDGDFGIEARSERAVRAEVEGALDRNADLVEFLGRGSYDHYVPAAVDHLADRSEFLTSYTQYQPEIAQGFLQVLFEYQSLLVELTGLGVANCSMYDAATALGEAGLLADRVRGVDGDAVLVPELLREERRSVLENYLDGAGLRVETYPASDGTADVAAVRDRAGEDTAMVYAETPTVRGAVEPALPAVGAAARDAGALFCVGTDPVALALLDVPGADPDVVVGDAVLGLPPGYGTGLGLFATREAYLRQVPGRLVGAGEDRAGERAFTLTLQTREQHIRRERATSNICTNQAWVALRAAIHAVLLGPGGLVDLAEDCVEYARSTAARIDEIPGATAPVHDRHHFREFAARVDRPAAVRDALAGRGYAVHALDDGIQVCVTEQNADAVGDLAAALAEVV
jgi:glycine dehydrogenase subunit 1